ncbi:MAG: YjgN family protein [Hyphomicrobiales bacterium]
MDHNRYQVIYKGQFLEGSDREKAYRIAAVVLSVSETKVRHLLNGQRVVLKKGLDETSARGMCTALQQAGIRVALGVPRDQVMDAGQASGALEQRPATAKLSLPSKSLEVTNISRGTATIRMKAKAPVARDAPGGLPAEVEQPTPLPAALASRVAFEFHGSGSEYFRIWIVNVLLSILTLGIYSAWAKVRNKQYFYGNTRINDAGFEYLAKPAQILRGRALVGCIFILTSMVSKFFPLADTIVGALFIFLFPWLIVRSLAFNAHNSSWRNIRFSFNATYGEAFKVYILWPLLVPLTLGIMSPYVFYRQKKFVVEHSYYGKTRFTFTATAGEYYRIFMVASLISILSVAILGGVAVLFAPLAILALPVYLYVFALFSVKTGNLLYNSSRLNRHRMESAMQVKSYALVVLTNTLATALTLGLFHPWAKVRTMRYKTGHLTLIPAGDLDAFVANKQKEVTAIGDASGDFLNFDLGL